MGAVEPQMKPGEQQIMWGHCNVVNLSTSHLAYVVEALPPAGQSHETSGCG